jgi:hypothetical protein
MAVVRLTIGLKKLLDLNGFLPGGQAQKVAIFGHLNLAFEDIAGAL